jgi:hypothetical protein
MSNVIDLNSFRPTLTDGEDCEPDDTVLFSLRVLASGEVDTFIDHSFLVEMEQVNWAIAAASVGMAKLADLKREMLPPEEKTWS